MMRKVTKKKVVLKLSFWRLDQMTAALSYNILGVEIYGSNKTSMDLLV